MKKKVVAVIPARMAASRFPGKPLVKILGLPMVEHVRRRVLLSDAVDDVFVATCDKEIMDAVISFGGKAVMTAKAHQRCTERVEEAARKIDADIFAIVQGDEPLFDPDVLSSLIAPLMSDESIFCTSLLSVISDRKDLDDIDIVKPVINNENDVMYFSRAPVPYFRVDNKAVCYRQTGISAFTKSSVREFTELAPTPLEICESVDFLRILQHGKKVRGVIIDQQTFGVDRDEDLGMIIDLLKNDAHQKRIYEKIMPQKGA